MLQEICPAHTAANIHKFVQKNPEGSTVQLGFFQSILLYKIPYELFLSLLIWMCVYICLSLFWACCCALDEWAGVSSRHPLASCLQTFTEEGSGAIKYCISKRPNRREMTRSNCQAEHDSGFPTSCCCFSVENWFGHWAGCPGEAVSSPGEFTSAHLRISLQLTHSPDRRCQNNFRAAND